MIPSKGEKQRFYSREKKLSCHIGQEKKKFIQAQKKVT
jgi:hypothetical protein